MTTISAGSKAFNEILTKASNSLSWLSAARPNICSSSPLFSPLAIICSIIGGKSLVCSKDTRKLVPSRTFSAANLTCCLIYKLPSTSPEIFILSNRGTALADNMLSVRANRAVFKPFTTFPKPGKVMIR